MAKNTGDTAYSYLIHRSSPLLNNEARLLELFEKDGFVATKEIGEHNCGNLITIDWSQA